MSTLTIHVFGGLGDVLAITPALRALKQQQPTLVLDILVGSDNHLRLLSNNPYIDTLSVIKKTPAWLERRQAINKIFQTIKHRLTRRKRQNIIRLSVGSLGTYVTYRKKMAHIIADALDLSLNNDQLEIHLTQTELDKGRRRALEHTTPIIINAMNRSRTAHVWPLERWNSVVSLFPELTFIQIGMLDEPRIKGTIDARDNSENSVRETVALLKFAQGYIGMDTFWQHAAAAVNTKGVVLHSDGHPAVFGHDLHINLFKNLRCAPCMPRLGASPCPYDVECIKSISVEEVAGAMRKQFSSLLSSI